MYDPKVGRWISEDPIGFDADDTNLVRYVSNEVTTHTDPLGHEKYGQTLFGPYKGPGLDKTKRSGMTTHKFSEYSPKLPRKLSGTWKVSIVTLTADQIGDCSHSYIRFENVETKEVHTLSKYPPLDYGFVSPSDPNAWVNPRGSKGVYWDYDLIYEKFVKSGQARMRSVDIVDPVLFFGKQPNDYTLGFDNCTTFAEQAWYFYAKEQFIDITPADPAAASRNIDLFNAMEQQHADELKALGPGFWTNGSTGEVYKFPNKPGGIPK